MQQYSIDYANINKRHYLLNNKRQYIVEQRPLRNLCVANTISCDNKNRCKVVRQEFKPCFAYDLISGKRNAYYFNANRW